MTQHFLPINVSPSTDQQQLQITLGTDVWQATRTLLAGGDRLDSWEGPELDGHTGARVLDTLFHTLGGERIELGDKAENAFNTAHPAWEVTGRGKTLHRAAFYQVREHWLTPALWPVMPEQWVNTGGIDHPRRPILGDKVLYRRFVPALGKTVTLRQATVDRDGERFHRWQNSPRVARFWEYPWSRERLDAMLEDRRADPHSLPLILEADEEAVGYFETYYVLEDRLAPHCDAGPYDQGMHVLVGEKAFLGNAQTPHWLNAVSHFLFLAEPRTRNLWGEPRADNKAMLRHTETTSWELRGEFDFPHKRAALMCNPRNRFFQDTRL